MKRASQNGSVDTIRTSTGSTASHPLETKAIVTTAGRTPLAPHYRHLTGGRCAHARPPHFPSRQLICLTFGTQFHNYNKQPAGPPLAGWLFMQCSDPPKHCNVNSAGGAYTHAYVPYVKDREHKRMLAAGGVGKQFGDYAYQGGPSYLCAFSHSYLLVTR